MNKYIWILIYCSTLAINWFHLMYTGDIAARYIGYNLSLWLVPLLIYSAILLLIFNLIKSSAKPKSLIAIGIALSYSPSVFLYVIALVTGEL
jgi:hypothetical protein